MIGNSIREAIEKRDGDGNGDEVHG
jgi:hypothetical protein